MILFYFFFFWPLRLPLSIENSFLGTSETFFFSKDINPVCVWVAILNSLNIFWFVQLTHIFLLSTFNEFLWFLPFNIKACRVVNFNLKIFTWSLPRPESCTWSRSKWSQRELIISIHFGLFHKLNKLQVDGCGKATFLNSSRVERLPVRKKSENPLLANLCARI